MSADQLLQYLTWLVFVGIFLSAVAEAIRRPVRANLDIALLFLAPAAAIVIQLAMTWGVLPSIGFLGDLRLFLVFTLPYLLVRLVDDFSRVPRLMLRFAELGLVLLAAGWFAFQPPRPAWFYSIAALYFIGGQIHATMAFAVESRRALGVTKRRMQSVAAGSVLLGSAIVAFALRELIPAQRELWTGLLEVSALLSGMFYFLGFATPSWLRQAWQAPELRDLLRRVPNLTRAPDLSVMLSDLEMGAANALGAPGARIGLWDDTARRLSFSEAGMPPVPQAGERLAGQAFAAQQPLLSTHEPRTAPNWPQLVEGESALELLAAPITAGEKRLGVIVVSAPRSPIFARDDMDLLQLLAAQAALLLESHALMEEAARVRARGQIAHLKEDFLSAAAHDLKTPLTVVLGQAQLLERRALRDPEAPADREGIQRLVEESRRMKTLVDRLLEASLAEHRRLDSARDRIDVTEIASEVCRRKSTSAHPCLVDAQQPVVGEFRLSRVTQLLENLVDNAMKYSPEGGEVLVRVWYEGGEAHLTVTDHGIGIPPEDQPHLFERFHRGANVDDRRFAGMGLGLFICRGVVEEHGGRITVESEPGRGSTFHVALPLRLANATRPAA